jgi:hypothetical protein
MLCMGALRICSGNYVRFYFYKFMLLRIVVGKSPDYVKNLKGSEVLYFNNLC